MNLSVYSAAYDFPVNFTRAANVFGAGQQLYRIIPRMILFIRLGRKLQLHGGGLSERSFIDIRDVSEATEQVACAGRPGQTYHISTDRIVSILSLVQMICAQLNVKFEDCVEITEERLGKDAAYKLDSTKIRQELGWTDLISLEQGIEETVAWIDLFIDKLKDLPMHYVHKA
jgi:dTDP-glucose 4,6-dehydratase